MLEQAISCHGAEESSLQAAESSWVCGLKGFFNYSKGPELKVGFPKILSLPFHREETGPSDRSCAVQERHSVRGSSSDKTQQCSKINERAPIIFLLWPLPFFLDRVLICSQWQIRRCEVLARNNNINSIQPAAWVSVGVGSMFKKKKRKSLWYQKQSSASPNLFFPLRLRTQGNKAGGWSPQWLIYTNGNRTSLVSFS